MKSSSALLFSSAVASVAVGISTALLVIHGINPTPWIFVPLLTFIAIQTGLSSARDARESAQKEAMGEIVKVTYPTLPKPTQVRVPKTFMKEK